MVLLYQPLSPSSASALNANYYNTNTNSSNNDNNNTIIAQSTNNNNTASNNNNSNNNTTQLGKYYFNEGLSLLNQKHNRTAALQYFNKSLHAFDKALDTNASDTDALINKGYALSELGRYQEAIQPFDKALQIDPQNVDAIHGKKLARSALLSHSSNNAENTNNKQD
jgi:tetratricopeptide (TPR) repeat protein